MTGRRDFALQAAGALIACGPLRAISNDWPAGAAALLIDGATGRDIAVRRPEALARSASLPGSALKPFVLAALLDRRLGRGLPCMAQRCAHPRLAAPLTADMALAYSCNHWFLETAGRLRPGELATALQRRFGFTIESNAGRELAIGEAGLRLTPRQMASAWRRLRTLLQREPVKYAPIQGGLAGAVEYGTARAAHVDGLRIAAKTGTTYDVMLAERIGWLCGWAIAPSGTSVLIVVQVHGGSGGPEAAPLAARLLSAWRTSLKH